MIYPNGWPAIIAVYGNPLDFLNDKATWQQRFVTKALRYPLPYVIGDVLVTRVTAHRLVIDDLVERLAHAWELTADKTRIRYGGCYNWRPKRTNAAQFSTHTLAIAVDLDPARNVLGAPWDPDTGVPAPVLEDFERAGWTSGKDWHTPDPMHLQAASGY